MKNLLHLFYFIFITTICNAQWTQIGEDIDGENPEDRFGRGVSSNSEGNIIAIGGFLNDGNGNNSGHVRIYEKLGNIWTQIGDDINGEYAGDESGFQLDLSNDGKVVAIGARFNIENGIQSGHVRVYEEIGGVWTQKGEDINGEGNYDVFGNFLSLNGDGTVLVISGHLSNGNNGESTGKVKVFEYINDAWTQIGDTLEGDVAGDRLGWGLSINDIGNIIAVGSEGYDGVNGEESGKVSIYENVSNEWIQVGQDLYGEASWDQFGYTVKLNDQGNIVIVSAVTNDGNGSNSGQVSVYEFINNNWVQIGQDLYGENEEDRLGSSLSINNSGNIIAIGAPQIIANGFNPGYVRIFENQNGVWIQIGDDIEGEEEGDGFGVDLSLNSSGNMVAIGAWTNDGINGEDSGHVRVFSNDFLNTEENHHFTDFSLYPNPTQDVLHLESQQQIERIKIYNLQGQLINPSAPLRNLKDSNSSVDVSQLSTGLYFVKITIEGKTITKKFIKE